MAPPARLGRDHPTQDAVSSPKPRPRSATPARVGEAAAFLGPLLRPVVLLLVSESPVHGYALVELLGELGVRPKGAGNLYRELRALEEQKLITSFWEASQTRGPARRVYRLTARGGRELERLMPVVAMVSSALVEVQARHRTLKASREAAVAAPKAPRTSRAGVAGPTPRRSRRQLQPPA